ncbi:hypothetical protein J6590_063597 [Homalodisca vitripennis]|nr:hypothetical protein J6590_063597 [Homalodisca vitripennis]
MRCRNTNAYVLIKSSQRPFPAVAMVFHYVVLAGWPWINGGTLLSEKVFPQLYPLPVIDNGRGASLDVSTESQLQISTVGSASLYELANCSQWPFDRSAGDSDRESYRTLRTPISVRQICRRNVNVSFMTLQDHFQEQCSAKFLHQSCNLFLAKRPLLLPRQRETHQLPISFNGEKSTALRGRGLRWWNQSRRTAPRRGQKPPIDERFSRISSCERAALSGAAPAN